MWKRGWFFFGDDDVLDQLNCCRGVCVMTTVRPFPVRLILIMPGFQGASQSATGHLSRDNICATVGPQKSCEKRHAVAKVKFGTEARMVL
jgi:hypothetical protein